MAKDTKKDLEELRSSFEDLRQQLLAVGAEMSKSMSPLTEANKEMRGLVNLSTKLRDNEEDISRLSDKQLNQVNSQAKSRLKNLKSSADLLANQARINTLDKKGNELQGAALSQRLKSLKTSNDITDEEMALLQARSQGFKIEQEFVEAAEREVGIREKSNKLYGIGSATLEGMSGILDKMGMKSLSQNLGLEDAKKAMQKTSDEIARSDKNTGLLSGRFQVLSSGIKVMGASLLAALGPLAIITALFDGMMQADKIAGDLAHNLGMSYNEASKMSEEMTKIHNEADNINIQTADLLKSQIAVGKAMGSNAQLNKADLKTMTEMTTAMGITHDEIMGIQKLSLMNGKSLKQNTKETLGAGKAYAMSKGLVLDQQQILKEVNKASASLKLTLGQSTGALAESVVKAKEFGLSLENAQSIANSMLDFESSIQAELEAELLTGKNLNFEKARQLALEGDIAGAAAEVAKQVGSAAEFGKMNVIQQEAIAKSMGLNREELANSLIEREALAKLSEYEGETMKEKYEAMKAAGLSEEEIREKIGNDEMARQLEQQSLQEQQQQAMMELQSMMIEMGQALMPFFEMLTEIAMVILPVIADVFSTIAGGIKSFVGYMKDFGKMLSKATGGSKILAGVFKGLIFAAGLVASYVAYAAAAVVPVIGPALGAAAAAVVMTGVSAAISRIKADDMMSPGDNSNGYGKRTLMGPEGAIQLNDKDTVIAGTNLFGDDVKSTGEGTEKSSKGSLGINMAPVVSAINALGAKIDKLGNISVQVDGAAIASTTVNNAEFDRSISNKTRELQ